MFKIDKKEPDFFIKTKRKIVNFNRKEAWSDNVINEIRTNLRKYILETEQYNICIYCEKVVILNNSHIDHFKKRSLFPEETLNYQNLLVSCNELDRCGKFKDTMISNKDENNELINPVIENPENFFEYDFNGTIKPKNSLIEVDRKRAEVTISKFNLNHPALIEERKKVISNLIIYLQQKLVNSVEDVINFGLKNFRSVTIFMLNIKEQIKNTV